MCGRRVGSSSTKKEDHQLIATGLDRIHKSMTAYVKSISKRGEADGKEKLLPVTRLGTSMVAHGDDYDGYSEYGRSLCSMLSLSIVVLSDGLVLGRTEERLGRVQENYINQATATYLEALERSLAQMKEYQVSRGLQWRFKSDSPRQLESDSTAADWPMTPPFRRCRRRRKRIFAWRKSCERRRSSTRRRMRT